MNNYLFVYGTLRSEVDHPMGRLLKSHARDLGPATINGHLFYIDHYPGLVPAKSQSRVSVKGQVYLLDNDPDLLRTLDDYEECGSSISRIAEYRREKHRVRLKRGGYVMAWVYVYRHSLRKCQPIIGGDYLSFKGRPQGDRLLKRGTL